MIVTECNCSVEYALGVLKTLPKGTWTCVCPAGSAYLVIKTGDDEFVVHGKLLFGSRHGDLAIRCGREIISWEVFWDHMIEVYDLDEDAQVIVDEL